MQLHSTVKRWGNSYAVRLTKADLRRLGVREGSVVALEVQPVRAPDLAGLPTFRDDLPLADARAHLYGQPRRWEA